MNSTRILLMDLETAPNRAWIWGKYEQNALGFDKEWYVLCYAYKWLGDKTTRAVSLPDFKKLYKKDPEYDARLMQELWDLLDEADIVIAHNGDQFDIKKANARFIAHGLQPPSPYKTIDTLKVARKHFKFNSNKLNDLGKHLGVGEKVETGGFKLWEGCMEGDLTSWKKMVKYNKQDVELLEKVYLKLRPWMTNHPNMNIVDETVGACPICSSTKIQKRGFSPTRVGKKQRYQCTACGGWSTGKSVKTNIEIR